MRLQFAVSRSFIENGLAEVVNRAGVQRSVFLSSIGLPKP